MLEKSYLTPVGWAKIKQELYQLVHHERPKTVEIVSWAASNGDRSENGDYIYGKRHLRSLDSRIHYLTKRLKTAVVIDPETREATDQIFFAATVVLQRENGRTEKISIVGVDEVEVKAGRISWISPLARALIGHKAGDTVTLNTPGKEEEITVLSVEYCKINY
jgi:transcription elongation factor greB